MSRNLDDLSSEFRPLVFVLLGRLVERGILLAIVQTLRTLAEHEHNLANGTSAVKLSKHLPRILRGWQTNDPDSQKCDAIDLAPYSTWLEYGPDKLNWDGTDAAFAVIAEEGEKLGLRSGARWKKPYDPGHLEFLFPGERYLDIPKDSAAFFDHGISRV